MRARVGVIATFLPTTSWIQCLRTAIRDRHDIIMCDDWTTLAQCCERQAVRVAVVDLFADGRVGFDQVRLLKRRLPRLAIIAYVAFTPDRVHDLFDAGRQGVDGLVIADVDDSPRTLLAVIEHAQSRHLGSVLRRLLEDVDPTACDALLLAVTRAHENLSPDEFARLFALPRRTLSHRLAAAGFPPPQRLLTWARLIVAAHMLEDHHRSADRVARTLAFGSGSAFRNTCQRYLHATPSEIRARGGAAYVMRALLRQVAAASSPAGGDGPAPWSGRHPLALAV